MVMLHSGGVEVSVTGLRANLSAWLGLACRGEAVVVTERGLPVARLLGHDMTATPERLTSEGIIGRPLRRRSLVAGATSPGRERGDRLRIS